MIETKYEWATLASGERGIVKVQRHVLAGSLWGSPLGQDDEQDEGVCCARLEVRYERSETDPNRMVIVERRIEEMADLVIKEEEGEDDSGGDDGYVTDLEEELQYSDVSFDETKAFWETQREVDELKEEAAEAQVATIPSIGSSDRGKLHAGSFAAHDPFLLLGRGRRAVKAIDQRTTQSASTMNFEPPSLTRVRVLCMLATPQYQEMAASTSLWVVRSCLPFAKAEHSWARKRTCFAIDDLMKLIKHVQVEPTFVRLLEEGEDDSSGSWVIQLKQPECHYRLAGGESDYTTFFDQRLFLWQRVSSQDFCKSTVWSMENLPPYLSDQEVSKQFLSLRNRRDLQFFQSITSTHGDSFDGVYHARARVAYGSMDDLDSRTRLKESKVHLCLDYSGLSVLAQEQCFFCGLDCSYEGASDYHEEGTCPYKAIFERHQQHHKQRNVNLVDD